MQEESGMSVQWVLDQYKEIIENNLKVDPAVAKGALDSVAKHFGMFKDRTEIDLKVSKKLEEFFT